MKIGIDIDEVLTSTNDYFLRYFNNKYNTSFKKSDITQYCFSMFEDYSEEFLLKEFIGHLDKNLMNFKIDSDAIDILKQLKQQGYELIIITARRLKIKDKTIQWLENFFGRDFFDDYLFYNSNRHEELCKAEICSQNNIDILIEDATPYVVEAAKRKIKVLVMDCPWNQDVEDNEYIKRVFNWKDIEKELSNLVLVKPF